MNKNLIALAIAASLLSTTALGLAQDSTTTVSSSAVEVQPMDSPKDVLEASKAGELKTVKEIKDSTMQTQPVDSPKDVLEASKAKEHKTIDKISDKGVDDASNNNTKHEQIHNKKLKRKAALKRNRK